MQETAVLFLAALVLVLCWLVLRGGLRQPAGAVSTGLTRNSAILGTLAIAAAMYLFGPILGLLVILQVVVHEYGHVAAYRVAGHSDARFRLIPFLGGVAISNRLPASHLHDFYITIMGPGICLGLIGAATLLYWLTAAEYPIVANLMDNLILVAAAFNFFNLLPVWPLDGGRALRAITVTVWPEAAHAATLAMCAVLAAFALYSGQLLLLLPVLLGVQGARTARSLDRRMAPMRRDEAIMAGVAWLCMLAVFGLLGWPLLGHYFRQG